MEGLLNTLLLLAVAVNLASVAYLLVAIRRVGLFQMRSRPSRAARPPVTILKPVCGLDPGLYGNLRSFCAQDYPKFQVIFGVRDPADPAVPIIRRVIEEFPLVDATLVIDGSVAGPNLKVSNLANMYRSAKHAHIVIADSDMRVDPNYLSSVIAPFEDERVGVVTCLYAGTAVGGIASRLASMFINEWFLPSVLVSVGLSELRFAFGATIAVRRELLERIGGFRRLSNVLADDHMLGKLVSARGFKVALSNYIVENVVYERDLAAMLRHELRWARTVRTVEPLGHAFSFLMYGIPLALFGAAMIDATIDWGALELAIIAVPILLRLWMHFTVCKKLGVPSGGGSIWLVPVRDVLSFLVWAASFFGRDIDWKGRHFTVRPDGLMTAAKGSDA